MFDKKIIQKNFSRGAKKYDEVALVQREAARELCELVTKWTPQQVRGDNQSSPQNNQPPHHNNQPPHHNNQPPHHNNQPPHHNNQLSPHNNQMSLRTCCGVQKILDLGSGTSFIAKNLSRIKNSQIFEIDLSAEMLQSWHNRPSNVFPIQGDIENLPFKNHSFDLIISSFSLQWIENFEKNFSKIFSLLKPNGTFAFCLPTFESLSELRAENIFNFNDLPKVEDLKSALKKSGFVEVFFQKKVTKQNFDNGYKALKSLKEIGASYSEKRKKIITKTQLKHFCLKNSGTTNKTISISWIISYFVLRKK